MLSFPPLPTRALGNLPPVPRYSAVARRASADP